jgi:predicted dehydrogenase
MSIINIGVLGAANIAKQFIRDTRSSTQIKVTTIASRSKEKSELFAKENGLELSYGTYEELLADKAIHAIYLPLPNSMHAEWAIKAAEAGKHILCEKPLALSATQANSMFAAARSNHVYLLESFPYFFQPQTQKLISILESGKIGKVRSVQSCFGFTLPNPQNNIRLNPKLGGGALLDAGSYALSIIRLAMGEAPTHVMADANWAESGVDMSTVATLYYADGRKAQLSCAMDAANYRRATISATAGTIDAEYLNHTSSIHAGDSFGYLTSQLRVRYGTANNIPFEDFQTQSGSGFLFAAEAFANMIATSDASLFELHAKASIDNSATLEALAQSAQQESKIEVTIPI